MTVQKLGLHFSDLKPDNILVSKTGEIKLGDLESLIMLHEPNKNNHPKAKFQNSIFGTMRYMAP